MEKKMINRAFIGYCLGFVFLLPASLLAKPGVNFKMQMFVDPNGYLSRGIDAAQLEKNKEIVFKRFQKNFQDPNIDVPAAYRLDITRAQFFRYFTHEDNGFLHIEDDTMRSKAAYTIDLVVGEDQNGLLAGIWLINNATGAIYRRNKATINKKDIRNVIQALLQMVDDLYKEFSKSKAKKLSETESISQIIERTETPTEAQVMVSVDTASMSHDRTVSITISSIRNVYDRPVFQYLGESMRLAVRLKEGSPGNIVSGEPSDKSNWRWDYVKAGTATFQYKLPDPSAFSAGKNPLKAAYEVAAVDYLDGKVRDDKKITIFGPDTFLIRADYAWRVSSTWNFRSKNINMTLSFDYELHYMMNCRDYLINDFFHKAMNAKDAWWYSGNLVKMKYEPLKEKGTVSGFKYTDCGLLDPWNLSDPTVDTIYVIGLPVGEDPSRVQIINLCFYFGGAYAKNAVDDAVDVFDLFNARVVGDRIASGFVDIPAKIPWMIDISQAQLASFQPFTNTYSASYTFSNYNCGQEQVDVTVTQKFTPVFEFSCIATREETQGGEGK
ncbi:MAG: hypothetical protein ABIM19_01245 [candidate division WOR-3 bacterium]